MKNNTLFWSSGMAISLLAIVLICVLDQEFSALLRYCILYFFSFTSAFMYGLLEKRGLGNKRKIGPREILFGKIAGAMWITIPSTIIFSLIIKEYFSFLGYWRLLMYSVWFFFAIIFCVYMLKIIKDMQKSNSFCKS